MPEPKDVERCEYMHVHEAIVNQVNQNMPDEEVLYDLAELFLSLIHISEPTRP